MIARTLNILLISALAAIVLAVQGLADDVNPYLMGFYWPVGDAYRCSLTIVSGDRSVALMDVVRVRFDVWDISDPPGWSHNLTDRILGWSVGGPEYYVVPGSSLGGFAFTSSVAPAGLGWGMMTDRSGIGGQATLEFVPEPAALTTLASLSLISGGALVRKRKRGE